MSSMNNWRYKLLLYRSRLSVFFDNNSNWLLPSSALVFAGWTAFFFLKSKELRRKNKTERSNSANSKFEDFLSGMSDTKSVPKDAIKFSPMSEEDKKIAISGQVMKRKLSDEEIAASSAGKSKSAYKSRTRSIDSDSVLDVQNNNYVFDYLINLFKK